MDSTQEVPLTPEILVPRLGDYLVEKTVITSEDLQRALEAQSNLAADDKHVLLGKILVEMGLITQAVLDQAITEQIIQLRAALQDSNQQLEQRVEQRTAELQYALKKLSELSQLKSNIVANISHELRTPLTHIKGYVDLLLSETFGGLTESQVNALKVMQRSSDRLENQIDDLIQISLSTKGELSLRLSDFDLDACLQKAVKRSESKAEEKDISLLLAAPKNLPRVRADEEKILWVLQQLIYNGIKFTSPGGRVVVSVEVDKKLVTISVADTGIGIPAERIAEIFEPFRQLDNSPTRRYGGTGLGLTLVKQILEAHGSDIRVTSKPDEGSRFEFFLPVKE